MPKAFVVSSTSEKAFLKILIMLYPDFYGMIDSLSNPHVTFELI